ncbi:MAG: amidase, partial [Polaromonas sp.]|nr:amidase [Polaromonas sp.]
MNPPSQITLSGDLHAARQALLAGQTSRNEILEQAAAIGRSDACRHVFMPGSAMNPLGGAMVPPYGGSGVLAGLPVSVKDLFDVAGQTTA